jgi:hypothetical protein
MRWKGEKLTEIGFTCSVLKDIEVFYWTVNGDIGWFEVQSSQSTSNTKVGRAALQNKSRSARFADCGNYFPARKTRRKWTGKIVVHPNRETYTY